MYAVDKPSWQTRYFDIINKEHVMINVVVQKVFVQKGTSFR